MKKQIVINASKDRSRIAIVENGELVELYIENPDNVRSIGNIYLGRVQKVMPAIRAAFVDVGEKQDCFLHFSDLTDNLPQLLAFAGEDVPGLDEPVLSLAPAKRVADDEDEPDVEEALEVEPAEDESTTRRSRGRRSRGRGRGRGRGSRREEEEEQEEDGEGRRPLPSVLDLSSAPKRRPTRSKPDPTPEPAPEPNSEPASEPEPEPEAMPEPEAEAPKPARRSRAKKKADAPSEPAEPTPDEPADDDRQPDAEAPADPEADAEDATDDEAPTKRKRRRGRRGRGKVDGDETSDETSDADDDAPAAGDDRQPSGRRGPREERSSDAPVEAEAADEAPKPKRRSKKKADPTDAAATDAPADDAPAETEPEDEDTTRRKPLPRTLDLSGSGSGGSGRSSRSRPATTEKTKPTSEGADEADEADASADETEAESTGRSRRRSRGGRSEGADEATQTSDDDRQPAAGDEPKSRRSRGRKPSADADEAPADAEPRSRRGGRSTTDAKAEAEAEDATDDRKGGGSSNGRSAGGRSGGSRSDSRGDSRSDSRGGSRGGSRGDAKGSGDRKKSSGPIPPNEELLRRDGRVLVKITKEAISTKGPRASTDLSLAGRFLVLVPAADYVAVSKKIESAKERRRLRTLAQSLKPDGFGVIVRTVAEGRDAKSLDTDLRLLADRWRKIDKKLKETPEPPVLLYQDVNMVSSIIRDLFSDDFDRILVDDPKVFKNVQAYVKAVAPDMADKVELHQGRSPVYRSLGIEKQVEEAFSKRVNMRGGGYLFIETTEAMHVVDVNSGRAGRGKSQKQNLLDVNVEAAREVAKQLRLRDLGGIIVVDFIDLKYDRDRRKVTDALKEGFKKDRAVTKILPMSDFGLVQITRQRLRPSITTQATDDDGEPLDAAEAAAAAGAGEIPRAEADHRRDDHRRDDDRRDEERRRNDREPAERPERPMLSPEDATPQALLGRLRGWLDHYRRTVDEKYRGRPIAVRVHPLFGAYLRRGFPSPLTRWRLALRGLPFVLEEDAAVDPLSFEVRDQKSGRSLVKKYAA